MRLDGKTFLFFNLKLLAALTGMLTSGNIYANFYCHSMGVEISDYFIHDEYTDQFFDQKCAMTRQEGKVNKSCPISSSID
jgi:hypothetical protein